VAIEKGELLLAVRGVVGRVRSMVMRRARPCSRLRWRAMTQSASASLMRNSSWRSGAFSKTRQRGLRGQILTVNGIAAHQQLVHRIACQTCGVVGVFISKAMPITRCVSSSSISCKILPGCRSSRRQAATRKSDPASGRPP